MNSTTFNAEKIKNGHPNAVKLWERCDVKKQLLFFVWSNTVFTNTNMCGSIKTKHLMVRVCI